MRPAHLVIGGVVVLVLLGALAWRRRGGPLAGLLRRRRVASAAPAPPLKVPAGLRGAPPPPPAAVNTTPAAPPHGAAPRAAEAAAAASPPAAPPPAAPPPAAPPPAAPPPQPQPAFHPAPAPRGRRASGRRTLKTKIKSKVAGGQLVSGAYDPSQPPIDRLKHGCPTARAVWRNHTVEYYGRGTMPPEFAAAMGTANETKTDTECIWNFPPGMHCFSCCSGWIPGCAGRKRDALARSNDVRALGQLASAPLHNATFAEDLIHVSHWALDTRWKGLANSRIILWGFGVAEQPISHAGCKEHIDHVALLTPAQYTGNIYHWLGEVLEPILRLSRDLGLAQKGEKLVVVPTQFTHGLGNYSKAGGWWVQVPFDFGRQEWFTDLAVARSRQSMAGVCVGTVHVACPRPPCPAHHRLAGSFRMIREYLKAPQKPLPPPAAGKRPLLLLNNRRPGGTRYITNADALKEAAQRQGQWDVQLLPMWSLKAAQMEPLFRESSAFVSLHGADLALALLFLPPRSTVVELWFTEDMRTEPVYVELGMASGIQYLQWFWTAKDMDLWALWVDATSKHGGLVWLPAQRGAGFKNFCSKSNATLSERLWGEMLTGLRALTAAAQTQS